MASRDELGDLMVRKASEKRLRVSEFVPELSKETGRSAREVTKELIRLEGERKLTLTDGTPGLSFYGYLASPHSFWFWGAAGATALSAALTGVSSVPLVYFRYVFGALLAGFLPGFAVVELLFPRKEELGELMRAGLSVGLSLALSPLAALVLNFTPFGVSLAPVLASLAGLTALLLILAAKRKHSFYRLSRGVG